MEAMILSATVNVSDEWIACRAVLWRRSKSGSECQCTDRVYEHSLLFDNTHQGTIKGSHFFEISDVIPERPDRAVVEIDNLLDEERMPMIRIRNNGHMFLG